MLRDVASKFLANKCHELWQQLYYFNYYFKANTWTVTSQNNIYLFVAIDFSHCQISNLFTICFYGMLWTSYQEGKE